MPRPEVRRLVRSLLEVDDREPADDETCFSVVPRALAIGPAVRHAPCHAPENLFVRRLRSDQTSDAAHQGRAPRARSTTLNSTSAFRSAHSSAAAACEARLNA